MPGHLDDLAGMRRRYDRGRLLEQDVDPDPLAQLRAWLADAVADGLPEPNAVALATATPEGRPTVRHVLVKALDDRGLVFYTSAGSRKGRDLAANPQAALTFPWFAAARQVLVEGRVERVPDADADAYWASRPYESQLGSAASEQSREVASRDVLERRLAELARRYPDAVPRPPQWGGYRLGPDAVEFWQGGPGRLHDRLRYVRDGASPTGWRLVRLSP